MPLGMTNRVLARNPSNFRSDTSLRSCSILSLSVQQRSSSCFGIKVRPRTTLRRKIPLPFYGMQNSAIQRDASFYFKPTEIPRELSDISQHLSKGILIMNSSRLCLYERPQSSIWCQLVPHTVVHAMAGSIRSDRRESRIF